MGRPLARYGPPRDVAPGGSGADGEARGQTRVGVAIAYVGQDQQGLLGRVHAPSGVKLVVRGRRSRPCVIEAGPARSGADDRWQDHPVRRATQSGLPRFKGADAGPSSDLLAMPADDVQAAVLRAGRPAYALPDDTLIPIDRRTAVLLRQTPMPRRECSGPDRSGRPTRTGPTCAARCHARPDRSTRHRPDRRRGDQGTGGSIRTPFKGHRLRPPLPRHQRPANRARSTDARPADTTLSVHGDGACSALRGPYRSTCEDSRVASFAHRWAHGRTHRATASVLLSRPVAGLASRDPYAGPDRQGVVPERAEAPVVTDSNQMTTLCI